MIRQLGGFAADCPINWGWRAAGGRSARGTAHGLLALVGMVASSRGVDDGPLTPLVAPAVALHDFRHPRRWLRTTLREFAGDWLRSRAFLESGISDPARLEKALDEHYSGARDHHTSLVFALDLALAHKLFVEQSG